GSAIARCVRHDARFKLDRCGAVMGQSDDSEIAASLTIGNACVRTAKSRLELLQFAYEYIKADMAVIAVQTLNDKLDAVASHFLGPNSPLAQTADCESRYVSLRPATEPNRIAARSGSLTFRLFQRKSNSVT